jgi:hypothetical protein
MSTSTKASNRFKVWDWVSFHYGVGSLMAQVVEQRGPLGRNQRELYRVRVVREIGEPDEFELPEDELQSASVPDHGAVIDYLKGGGLVAILRANLNGGANQPRVWLTYTPRGSVTHTFDSERGILGGATVPFFALHEGRIFAGKEKDVVEFLASFGLDRAEAELLITTVGTAP